MRQQIGVFFLAATLSVTALAQSVTTQTIELDAKKPILVDIHTLNLGPEFQCYYGLLAGRSKSAFPVFLNSNQLEVGNNYEFSDVFEFSIVDAERINGFEFASLVECWVIGGINTSVSSAQFTIKLRQDKLGPVIFMDSFSGFVQNGHLDLWSSSPREVIKRIKFKLK